MARKQKKQAGYTYTLEIIFVATILVIGLLSGWVQMRDTALGELSDIARAIGALNQSYTFNGAAEIDLNGPNGPENTITAGSRFVANEDSSDNFLVNLAVEPEGEALGFPAAIFGVQSPDDPANP